MIDSDWMKRNRFFPRLFALLYMALLWIVVDWAMGLVDMSNAQAAFSASIVTAGAAYFKFYVESGNDAQ